MNRYFNTHSLKNDALKGTNMIGLYGADHIDIFMTIDKD